MGNPMGDLMGDLTGDRPGVFPGAERVLAAQASLLPQPDQLCGPFAAHVALHAVLDEPPSVLDLARAAGTRVWPHEDRALRPRGAPFSRRHWDLLPRAGAVGEAGTDAAPLAAAVESVTGAPGRPGVRVVRALPRDPAGLGLLLAAVRDGTAAGVVANLRTGPTWPAGDPHAAWDVGHFVVLWSSDGATVGVADSYAEVGAPGWPAGCRGVPLTALHDALHAPPARSLLLLAAPGRAEQVRALVERLGSVVA